MEWGRVREAASRARVFRMLPSRKHLTNSTTSEQIDTSEKICAVFWCQCFWNWIAHLTLFKHCTCVVCSRTSEKSEILLLRDSENRFACVWVSDDSGSNQTLRLIITTVYTQVLRSENSRSKSLMSNIALTVSRWKPFRIFDRRYGYVLNGLLFS